MRRRRRRRRRVGVGGIPGNMGRQAILQVCRDREPATQRHPVRFTLGAYVDRLRVLERLVRHSALGADAVRIRMVAALLHACFMRYRLAYRLTAFYMCLVLFSMYSQRFAARV